MMLKAPGALEERRRWKTCILWGSYCPVQNGVTIIVLKIREFEPVATKGVEEGYIFKRLFIEVT